VNWEISLIEHHKMNEFAARMITIIIGGTLSILFISLDPRALRAFFNLIYAYSMIEYCQLLELNKFVWAVTTLLPMMIYESDMLWLAIFNYLILLAYDPKDTVRSILGVIWFYPAMWSCIQIGVHHGATMIIILLTIAWMSDGMAYMLGKYVGSVKLAPSISPNKTVEGSLSGVCGSLFITYFISIFYDGIPRSDLLNISIISAVFGQLGDLFESAFKRKLGVKDTGVIMGRGHGGLIDRFDSIFFAIPLVHYYLNN